MILVIIINHLYKIHIKLTIIKIIQLLKIIVMLNQDRFQKLNNKLIKLINILLLRMIIN